MARMTHGAINLPIISRAIFGQEIGPMEEGEIMYRNDGWHRGIEWRDKISAMDQIERLPEKFNRQEKLFNPMMHRRIQRAAVKVFLIDQRLAMFAMLKNDKIVVLIQLSEST
jgi:hypothetical protein